jgi:hypothetical protein
MCCFPSKTSHLVANSTSMRLVLTHSAKHYAPKRHARYTPMPATPRRVVSLLRAYPNGQDPPLCSGEKPHGLRFGIPKLLPHSIPQPPQPV